jgi:hypothetical protein
VSTGVAASAWRSCESVRSTCTGQGANRITALVAHEDEAASAFWNSAGYPRDRQIGRRVRNLS